MQSLTGGSKWSTLELPGQTLPAITCRALGLARGAGLEPGWANTPFEVSEGCAGSGQLAAPVPLPKHEAGLGNAPLGVFRQTPAPVVRSQGAEVAAGPGHCWCSGQWPCPLRGALRSSHLLTRQGDIPNGLLVFKNGAQAPKAPQQPSDLHSCCKVLLWALLDAVLISSWLFAPQRGSEGFFSFLAHVFM